MTNQNNWEEEFIRLSDQEKCTAEETLLATEYVFGSERKEIFSQYPESSYELDHEKVVNFIRKVEVDAERRGYNEGYSDALNACKILIAEQGAQGALHGIEMLAKSLNTPPND